MTHIPPRSELVFIKSTVRFLQEAALRLELYVLCVLSSSSHISIHSLATAVLVLIMLLLYLLFLLLLLLALGSLLYRSPSLASASAAVLFHRVTAKRKSQLPAEDTWVRVQLTHSPLHRMSCSFPTVDGG